MEIRLNYSDIKFQENGRLKLLIIVGTRPEIIRLAAVINKCREYFDCLLAHTGQNYDYNLNGIFFRDLKLKDPDVYMDAVGDDLGATMGNIINAGYKLMVQTRPDAVLVLGDTNSCLSVIGAKRLHIPIFHMEAGNRCFDECLPEETNRRIVDIISDVNLCYSEHARRYLNASGLQRNGLMLQALRWLRCCMRICLQSNPRIFIIDWAFKKAGIFFCLPIGRRILIRKRIFFRCLRQSMLWQRNMTCQFSTVVILAAGSVWRQVALNLTAAWCSMNLSVSMITTACR